MDFVGTFPQQHFCSMSIDNYMSYLEKNQWTLYCFNINNDTYPKEYYREIIESIFMNTLTSNIVVSVDNHNLKGHILYDAHRTAAIQKFLNNEFKIKIEDEYKSFSELDELLKKRFETKTINIVRYYNLTPSQEEKLFLIHNKMSSRYSNVVV